MEILRTRFKKDIVCEFLPPASAKTLRRSKLARPSDKVIIFCKGMPGLPRFPQVLEFWAKKGYWVFLPRYRGTMESNGEFLKKSPHLDILDVIDELPKGFVDLWSGKSYKLSAKSYKLFIFGGSFGGPAAILCSRDPRVTKAVAFAPVIDWEAPSKEEPMDKLGAFIQKGFGNCYRFSKKNWNRLSHNEFYSPITLLSSPQFREGLGRGGVPEKPFDGKKLLIFHAINDRSVPYSCTKKFAAKTGAKLITLGTGGHFGFSKSTQARFYKEIKK
ncbi:MAG: prolyl oligopeptidase family serine peptidase, partial [Patescibacteria group bacterium]